MGAEQHSYAWQLASVPQRQRVRHGMSNADKLGCCRRMLPQSEIDDESITQAPCGSGSGDRTKCPPQPGVNEQPISAATEKAGPTAPV